MIFYNAVLKLVYIFNSAPKSITYFSDYKAPFCIIFPLIFFIPYESSHITELNLYITETFFKDKNKIVFVFVYFLVLLFIKFCVSHFAFWMCRDVLHFQENLLAR